MMAGGSDIALAPAPLAPLRAGGGAHAGPGDDRVAGINRSYL